MRIVRILLLSLMGGLAFSRFVAAAPFGLVSGVVEDAQHRPIAQASVILHATLSDWQQQAQSDIRGTFAFQAVPAGDYTVTATKSGFDILDQTIVVRSGTTTPVTMAMRVGAVTETVKITANETAVDTRSATTQSLVTRDQIQHTPGALRSNSLDVVTQFVPGAYLVHDQLHIRGGHQVSWLVDGVPVPNTNIATTVGPQFDPKDIETIEIQRGGYSAEFGDRTYGVFNVVPRSGFERDREAEVVANYGSFRQTDDQFSLGDHRDRLAYYGSVNATHSDVGLETPVARTLHDRASGLGGFLSLVNRSSPTDQLRFVASVRGDQYQIPNDPDAQAAGVDDRQRERDGFANLSWMRTMGSGAFLTLSPFYHYNRAAYDGSPADPIDTLDHRASQYAGGQAVLAVSRGGHLARIGGYGFSQRDGVLFGLQSGGAALLGQSQTSTGSVDVGFAEDQYAATDWLTLNGGLRLTRFAGALAEHAVDPRLGAAIRLPRAGAVVRASYGRYYQPPPLTTVTGSLLDLAAQDGFAFLPLKGERDDQYEVGVAVPVRGWSVDVDTFRTDARNFFDHDAVGNSNIFIPLTIDRARIRGWEATLRSPASVRVQAHVAYSHQFVEGRGGVSGGLTDFTPPEDGYFFLDHDQRDTLTGGVDLRMRAGTWLSASMEFGSGFLEGDGPGHKPAHAVVSAQATRTVGPQWTLVASALNIANTRFLLDESNTFGGTHFNGPRQFSVGARYRFRY